jgi:hypothetical protein
MNNFRYFFNSREQTAAELEHESQLTEIGLSGSNSQLNTGKINMPLYNIIFVQGMSI